VGSRCNSLLLEVSGGDWLTGIPPGHELKLSTINKQTNLVDKRYQSSSLTVVRRTEIT
jgi:hypothetical protein